MLGVHGRGWAPRWSEKHSRSYGSSEAQAQARTGPRGPRQDIDPGQRALSRNS